MFYSAKKNTLMAISCLVKFSILGGAFFVSFFKTVSKMFGVSKANL